MQTPSRVAVLGGGSFGTAIANLIAENEHDVRLWLRNEERAAEINLQRVNSQYLPDLVLNERVSASTELAEAVKDAEYIFVAVPSKSIRDVARQLNKTIDKRMKSDTYCRYKTNTHFRFIWIFFTDKSR